MWFSENQMKTNQHKHHVLLMFGNNKEPFKLDLGRLKINQSKRRTTTRSDF